MTAKSFGRYANQVKLVNSKFIFSVLETVILLILFSGCTVGPDYQRPESAVPAQWRGSTQPAPAMYQATADKELTCWWTVFGDPTLSSLVERAAVANLDLKLAEARIRQARAARAVVAGGLGPSLGAAGDYRRSRSSISGANGQTASVTSDQYQAGFDAGWEIDIFGGQRRSLEAADADLQVAVESHRDVLVSLMAEVARNYIQLRAYQQQIVITRQNLAAQQHSAKLTPRTLRRRIRQRSGRGQRRSANRHDRRPDSAAGILGPADDLRPQHPHWRSTGGAGS